MSAKARASITVGERTLHSEPKVAPTDELDELRGNELARVTVSMDLADKNFGRGFSTYVSVSLACDQSMSGVRTAHAVATALAEDFLAESYEIACDLARRKQGDE